MQAATQLLFLILAGVFLAQWLIEHQHWPSYTLAVFPVVAMGLGILMLYKQTLMQVAQSEQADAEKSKGADKGVDDEKDL